jgi:Flp pilus assembly protein TadD
MIREKIIKNQYVNRILPLTATALLTVLLAGCADSMDQTKDIDANTSNMVRVATQMHAQGDDEGAAQFYQRALQRNPNDIEAHKGLAELLEAHGDVASAAGQYHALVELDSDNADYLRSYGRVLIKLNRPTEAKDQYEAALRIDSDDIKARNGLGISLDYLGNHAAAQEQYKQALDQNANDLPSLSNLAHSYVLSGHYDEAIRLLEPQCRNSGAPPALRQNLAEAYALAGMDVDAERVARMDLSPEDVKKNMDFYHAERARLLPAGAVVYADLGGFATPDLAQARADVLKEQFARDVVHLTFEVTPEVKKEGGTPEFFIHVRGFNKISAAKAFCEKLRKQEIFCKVVS